MKNTVGEKINWFKFIKNEAFALEFVWSLLLCSVFKEEKRKTHPKSFKMAMFLFFLLFSQNVALKDHLSHRPGDIVSYLFIYLFIYFPLCEGENDVVRKNN